MKASKAKNHQSRHTGVGQRAKLTVRPQRVGWIVQNIVRRYTVDGVEHDELRYAEAWRVSSTSQAAKAKGMKVVILTGKDGGKLSGVADVEICVPHFRYADRIQEIHIKVIHILIMLIEKGTA